mmetsp:Transcript_27550/g.58210  ORF Transcript_27550/g.58210 Transcript_27550/m.58210 type:complete len:447 (-) Transcript_27550:63-1403(-)|eukprot:CAMPEP_0183770738 /NCGR_PEP_ID=MMETSP0739-20130205/29856_1 /TAXON_ID=385413 /ORGANISM="Thalassiosira miniscula, Strain CCMP1093" /LENGTH=446 /DNA_ID=CAMNT_0026010871 /DNA_START=146 /DNA_END=1486 /DNA_ORIENTATION=+
MISPSSRATPLFLFVASSAAATLLLAPSGCHASSEGTGESSTSSVRQETVSDEIYSILGVEPPQYRFRVLKLMGLRFPLSRWSWKLHGRLLPLLHLFDGEKDRPQDVFVNLRVLWCKLLTSLDPKSPAYEGPKWDSGGGDSNASESTNTIVEYFTTYRMLPPYSIKWALWYLGLWRCFPRWMHANIELRTVYLQGAFDKILKESGNKRPESTTNVILDNQSNVCVIILGGGYDSRGAKLSTSGAIRRVYELDLPAVVGSKRRLLQRAGFHVLDNYSNRDNQNSNNDDRLHGVRLEGVDLNNDEEVDRVLDKLRDELVSSMAQIPHTWHIIVIAEAVLMYLDTGKAGRLLEGLANRFGGMEGNLHNSKFTKASFVFADRLIRPETTPTNSATIEMKSGNTCDGDKKHTTDSEECKVQKWLQDRGWELQEILFKPGATRHLGIATAGR